MKTYPRKCFPARTKSRVSSSVMSTVRTGGLMKRLYISGPAPEEVPTEYQEALKGFYSRFGDFASTLMPNAERPFIPHEVYRTEDDGYSPTQAAIGRREQLYYRTFLLVSVPVSPSADCGVEVEMAYANSVPVVLLWKLNERQHWARMLVYNPAVVNVIYYNNLEDAVIKFGNWLSPNLSDYLRNPYIGRR